MPKVWVVLLFIVLGIMLGFIAASHLFFDVLIKASSSLIDSELLNDIRKWLAALSGYFGALVALVAAAATVSVLSRQITEASEQHRELLKIQAHDKLTLAKQVHSASSYASSAIKQLVDEIFRNDGDLSGKQLDFFVTITERVNTRIKEEELTDKTFRLLGERLGPERPEVVLDEWARSVERIRLSPWNGRKDDTLRERLRQCSAALVMLDVQLSYTSKEARDFILRWRHIAA